MLADKTIALIGGGNMAEALIRGLVDKADIESARVGVSGPRKARVETLSERYKIRSETDNKKLAAWAIVGLHTLEEGGLRTTLINAVEAATRRARELGDKG